MPILLFVEKRIFWFTWDSKCVMKDWEYHFALDKMVVRVYKKEGYSLLNKINPLSIVEFGKKEVPLLLEELRKYRNQLESDQLEEPDFNKEVARYYEMSTEMPFNYQISDDERDEISKILELVEEYTGRGYINICFAGY
jgi:hypothetical protein